MSRVRILLVEDDSDDREFFKNFLGERSDIRLLPELEDGEQLIQFLEGIHNQSDLPDAIIMDQNMPKLSGLQALDRMKRNNMHAEIPVMIYSTYADDKLVKQSIASGAILVMTKPTTPEGYDKLVNTLLNQMLLRQE